MAKANSSSTLRAVEAEGGTSSTDRHDATLEQRRGLDPVASFVRNRLFGLKAAANAISMLSEMAPEDEEACADTRLMVLSMHAQLGDLIAYINKAEKEAMKGGAA